MHASRASTIILLLIASTAALAQPPPVHGQGDVSVGLEDYMGQLQADPDNRPIREKIIKLVASMPAPPPLPENAEERGFKAEYLAKSAKSKADFQAAADKYFYATVLAPWVADFYKNLGLALVGAEEYEDAKDKFELYLIAAPNAPDGAAVRKKIAEIEVRMEQAEDAKKAALEEAERNGGMRAFQSEVEGKTYDQQVCIDATKLWCTWPHFYAAITGKEANWSTSTRGSEYAPGKYHWIFSGGMAYLVYAEWGDDIRNAKTRLRGPGPTIDSLTWENRVTHDDGQSYKWETTHYGQRQTDRSGVYYVFCFNCQTHPSSDPAQRHQFFLLSP